ncbi:hypothetical protein BJ944DRAFT_261801 [Cunninghamella echinulata]|nr:hypothetical protein BJ944DRAFT_261801 [Cunninghamella echinulata]
MIQFRRIQIILLSIITIGLTGFIYRWHTLNDISQWIPPNMYDQDDNHDLVIKRQAIDNKYCGGPCRFILPVFIMEQESKAQMHFRQLAFMSGLVNRTIILPNVGGSRLGACLPHDFEFYYSLKWAQDNKQHFNYITMNDFKQWLLERQAIQRPATSQSMHIHVNLRSHALEPKNCFEQDLLLNMDGLPERRLYLNETANPTRRVYYENAVKEFFLGMHHDQDTGEIIQDNITKNMEVLSVYYDRRFPFVHNPAAEPSIPYSETLNHQADTIAGSLSPFWAVHWRTERVEPSSNLVDCAMSLVNYMNRQVPLLTMNKNNNNNNKQEADLHQQRQQQEQPTLFLLTDYPHVFNEEDLEESILNNKTSRNMIPASASFAPQNLTTHHHQAMQYVYQHLNIKVTHLGQDNKYSLPSNWSVVSIPDDIAHQDTGWLGILDKLLAMRADGFLAGAPGICGRKSSFTNQIMNERLDHPRLNVIDYFDLPKNEEKDDDDDDELDK